MLATITQILAIAGTVMQTANTLIQTGQDAAPAMTLLQKLFGKEPVTTADLDDIRAQNDALHNALQAQTETGE